MSDNSGFSTATIFNGGIQVLTKYLVMFLAVAAAAQAPVFLIQLLVPVNTATALLVSFVNFAAMSLASGVITVAVLRDAHGDTPSLGDCVTVALSRLVPLLVSSVVVGLAVAAGFLLLIIPGLILLAMLALAAPAVIAENLDGVSAVKRSLELTKGTWKEVGSAVIGVALIGAILGIVIARVVGPNAVGAILALVLGSATTAWLASTIAVAYVEVRRAKEGVDVAALAQIFD